MEVLVGKAQVDAAIWETFSRPWISICGCLVILERACPCRSCFPISCKHCDPGWCKKHPITLPESISVWEAIPGVPFFWGELPCPSWMKPPGTVVLIAHRLSTVINATQICVIHKGLIVEKGTHDELVAQGGVYAQLVSRQLSRDASAVMGEKKAKDAKKTNQSLVIFIGLRECLQETLNCMFWLWISAVVSCTSSLLRYLQIMRLGNDLV